MDTRHFGYVLLGAHNWTQKEPSQVKIKAKEFISHPNHSAVTDDIALIRLEYAVELTGRFK